jgi:excisionase family DNA binding protein
LSRQEHQTVVRANLTDPLLTVEDAGAALGTGPRLPRRLIAERRIRYVKVGRHVRIPESALIEYVSAGTVEPRTERRRRWVA